MTTSTPADPLAGLDERLDRLLLTARDNERFILSTESAKNIVGIVREWLRVHSSTPASTDAGSLADRIDAAHFIKLVGMDRDVNAEERDLIVAALRNSAPQETRGDEPVGNRSSSAPEPCSDLSINELIEWLDAPQYTNGFLDFEAANHMSAAAELLDKLYPENLPALGAHQQSPRLEREGIKRKLIEMGFTSRDGTVINGGTFGVIDAILPLLSPSGPMVPWELDCQRRICAAPECECPEVSSTSRCEVGK